MPRSDRILSPLLSLLRQFRRLMLWMGLFAIVVAAIAILLVAHGETAAQVHMLVAIALGAGLSVLLAGALMSLVFVSAHRGHDDAANSFEGDERP